MQKENKKTQESCFHFIIETPMIIVIISVFRLCERREEWILGSVRKMHDCNAGYKKGTPTLTHPTKWKMKKQNTPFKIFLDFCQMTR